jgi:S-adenosylmethionine decarboxylase proenzyme
MTQLHPTIKPSDAPMASGYTLTHPSVSPVTTMLGRHLLAEFYDCDPNILNNADLIEAGMTDAAIESGATIVQKTFHHFSPWGVSGVVVIAESHLAIHTWPEYGYAAVDLFTCGDSVDPLVAYEHLKKAFSAKTAFYSELKRGLIHQGDGHLMKTPFAIGHEHIDGPLPEQVEQQLEEISR